MNKLDLKTEGDRYVVITRHIKASPDTVYRAHIDTALIQKWMLGPQGWTMPSCEADPRVGGKIRFEWENGAGHSFYLTGEYLEMEPGKRIVHTECMHMPDALPENRVETRFEADENGTFLTMRMTLPNQISRDMMLQGGIANGMEASYQRLDRLIS